MLFEKKCTEAEKSLKTAEQAMKAAQERITTLEQQFSRDNASMSFFRSQIDKLTEENKVLQEKLNEVTHSLKVSKEINVALKQQVKRK